MRLRKFKKVCYKSNFIRSPYIYKIIESGILDRPIKKIKYKKIQTTMYQTFKKGKTNTYFLFLLNVDKFLMFLDLNFIINTTEKFTVLRNIFNCKHSDIFLSTGDINSNRDFYIHNYKKLIIENFYKTLNLLYQNNEEAKNNLGKIFDINEYSLNDDDDIEKIFIFLKNIVNCSRENIQYLFYDYECLISNDIYLDTYFELFDNYKQRKNYLKYLGL